MAGTSAAGNPMASSQGKATAAPHRARACVSIAALVVTLILAFHTMRRIGSHRFAAFLEWVAFNDGHDERRKAVMIGFQRFDNLIDGASVRRLQSAPEGVRQQLLRDAGSGASGFK